MAAGVGHRHWPSATHYRAVAGFAGLQFVFTALINHGVTHYRSLGLNQNVINLIVMAGPITGVIFSPLLGAWGDDKHAGRRRRETSIFVGTFILVLSMIAIAWTESLVRLFDQSKTDRESLATTIIAVIFSYSAWTAVQAVSVNLRALVNDKFESREQPQVMASISHVCNLTATLANFAAYLGGSKRGASSTTAFKLLTVLTALSLTVSIIATVPFIRGHTPWQPDISSSLSLSHDDAVEASNTAIYKSTQLRTIYFTQFFAWCGFFVFLFYAESYVNRIGEEQKTTISAPGALMLLLYSATALCASLLLPFLSSRYRCFSMRNIWIASHACFALVMLATFICNNVVFTMSSFVLIGFSWAATSWIPFALVGFEACRTVDPHNNWEAVQLLEESEIKEQPSGLGATSGLKGSGLLHGLHTLSVCLPQIIMSICTTLATAFFHDAQRNVVWMLRLGGLCSVAAAIHATRIKNPQHSHSSR